VGAGLIEMARVQGHDANKLDTTMSCMHVRWWRFVVKVGLRLQHHDGLLYTTRVSRSGRGFLRIPFTRTASAGTQSPKVGGYLRVSLVL
jgi:hypothetical protein